MIDNYCRLCNTMAGRLTEGDKDRIEQWIGKGPKSFTLLYSITRDGCNATTFHQKCDNQGPTVTVLYNQQGSVYGGYTSASWCSVNGGQYANTEDSFMFQLKSSGNQKENKFPLKPEGKQHSIYCYTNYGPLFGEDGTDLNTFNGRINNAGGSFSLNGSMNIGKNYDNLGIARDQINNGSMTSTELEVYKITGIQ